MTTVWLCEPRSHGRRKAGGASPGRRPSSAVPHRSASPALCPCGHAASFRRRAPSFVGRPVCKPPERGARMPVCKAARGGHIQAGRRGWPARVQAPRRAGGAGSPFVCGPCTRPPGCWPNSFFYFFAWQLFEHGRHLQENTKAPTAGRAAGARRETQRQSPRRPEPRAPGDFPKKLFFPGHRRGNTPFFSGPALPPAMPTMTTQRPPPRLWPPQ